MYRILAVAAILAVCLFPLIAPPPAEACDGALFAGRPLSRVGSAVVNRLRERPLIRGAGRAIFRPFARIFGRG